jgi:ABC-2 type transport system ATP-binding protein
MFAIVMLMQTAIEAKNLSVVYKSGFKALDGVDLELQAGKITGFIGPSGAGKTTLVRVLVGRQKITSGQATVLGRPAGSGSLRGQFSYMTQSLSVYPDLTVTENLDYFAHMLGLSGTEAKNAVFEAIQRVDLRPQSKQVVSNLSGGQKQRASLAVALLGDPPILFLDEPTVGLDPVLREQLWELFRELAAKGKTVIVTSHVMDEADRCDDLVLIRAGQVLAHGSPKELCNQTHSRSVEESFIKLVKGVR